LNEKLKNAAKLNLTTKKFVLIQSGCDSFCSFCLTVKKRGKHFSRSKEEIISEINEFKKSGGKEIVLT
jgi:threonylcarbamoyladenosine tRNA methylthiotransferase MtaB